VKYLDDYRAGDKMKVFYEFDEGDDDFIRRCFESGLRSFRALEQIAGIIRDTGEEIDNGGIDDVDIEDIMHTLGEIVRSSPYSEI